jgi:hypothetical protein
MAIGSRSVGIESGIDFVLEDLGIDSGEAAAEPVVADGRIDIKALFSLRQQQASGRGDGRIAGK